MRLLLSVSAAIVLIIVPACSNPGQKSSEVDRTIKIFMRDDNTYQPSEIEVVAGENIAFDVTNAGGLVHEFLIGTAEQQQSMSERMESGEHEGHGSSVPGVVLKPGKRETFTYKVPPKKGRLFFGCHEPGHYEAGMRGEMKYRS